MKCGLIDVPCHIETWFWGLVGLVPWWGWVAAAALLAIIVWRLLGWWGLVGLAGIAGFILGRRNEPFPVDLPEQDAEPPMPRRKPRKTRKTIADLFRR